MDMEGLGMALKKGVEKKSDAMTVVKALLKKDISYIKEGELVVVKAGSSIVLDLIQRIALVENGDHVSEMTPDEYVLPFIN